MFFLTGMGSLKLILFAFDKVPLFPLPSLLQLILFTCFLIKKPEKTKSLSSFPRWLFAIKVAIYGMLLYVRKYKQNLTPCVLLLALNFYLPLEILLTVIKFLLTTVADLRIN
ncbi:unnamed protein product [Eruca vesicaria subsp. sativa]|uniref:ATP synthase F0 subunit 6 n=1 Tax=Eruca vesicaria subsp. sativa TaxID=29727 RepID=A0ABC8JRY7_ERUVS|nr:unnamed protein product [Eruca vesicaria subsp. sativa]